MEAIKLTVEERLDIAELAVRYGNIVDDRDWSRFSELFTEDAVLTISGLPDGEVVQDGMAAIVEYMETSRHAVSHHITNVELVSQGDAVRVRAKIIGPGRTGRVGVGDYDDLVVRTDSGWRISRKRLTLRTGD